MAERCVLQCSFEKWIMYIYNVFNFTKKSTGQSQKGRTETHIFCPHLICERAAGFTGVKGWKIPWSLWFQRALCDITGRPFHWSVCCFPSWNRESPRSTLGCVLNVESDAFRIQKGLTRQTFLSSLTSCWLGLSLKIYPQQWLLLSFRNNEI